MLSQVRWLWEVSLRRQHVNRGLNEARGLTGVQVEELSKRRTARTRCGWAQWSEKREADDKVTSLPLTASANRVLCRRPLWVLFSGWCQLPPASHGPSQHPHPLVLGSCASRMSMALHVGLPDPNTLSSTPTKGCGKLEWGGGRPISLQAHDPKVPAHLLPSEISGSQLGNSRYDQAHLQMTENPC